VRALSGKAGPPAAPERQLSLAGPKTCQISVSFSASREWASTFRNPMHAVDSSTLIRWAVWMEAFKSAMQPDSFPAQFPLIAHIYLS
jgi:hypothetical protein